MKYQEILNKGTQILRSKNIKSSNLDCELILSKVLSIFGGLGLLIYAILFADSKYYQPISWQQSFQIIHDQLKKKYKFKLKTKH